MIKNGQIVPSEVTVNLLLGAMEVGPGRYCPPRHPTYCKPSSLELNCNL
jgi:hypothetical protein